MFGDFEAVFEVAQSLSHSKVIKHVTDLEVKVWPPLPPLPIPHHNPTPSEQHQFEGELRAWSDANFFTIPALQHQTYSTYDKMHYSETLAAVYLEQESSPFANDTIAFEHLTLSFLYRISLPDYCGRCPYFILLNSSLNLNRGRLSSP